MTTSMRGGLNAHGDISALGNITGDTLTSNNDMSIVGQLVSSLGVQINKDIGSVPSFAILDIGDLHSGFNGFVVNNVAIDEELDHQQFWIPEDETIPTVIYNDALITGGSPNYAALRIKKAFGAETVGQKWVQFCHNASATPENITDAGTILSEIQTNASSNCEFVSASSRTIKENIRGNDDECYDIVNSLRSVRYNLIGQEEKNECDGWIAEEIAEIYPNAAATVRDIPAICRASLTPVLWGALRKTMKEVDELKAQISQISG